MKKTLLPLTLVTILSSLVTLHADEWARFRGPNGTGVGSGDSIPVKFSESDIKFKVELPGGSGCSSPVVWGDKVFVLSADPKDATRYVLCFNADTGEKIWQKDYKSEVHHLHTRSSFASCTPAVDEERVYVAWSTPKETFFKAFNHDGSEAWSIDLGTWQSQHGWGTSPIVYKNLVILHNSQQANELKEGEMPGESRMMAFDRKTGEQKWTTPLVSKNVCYSVPLIHQPADGGPDELICTSTGNGMFSLDPLTGKENWAVNDGLFSMRTVSSPVEAGGLIFGSTGSGAYSANYIVAVKPGKNAEVVYKLTNNNNFKAPYVPCLIADGDLLFACTTKALPVALTRRRAMFTGPNEPTPRFPVHRCVSAIESTALTKPVSCGSLPHRRNTSCWPKTNSAEKAAQRQPSPTGVCMSGLFRI